MIFGIPSIIFFAQRTNTGIKFTTGGFLLITLFIPLQGIAEELTYRAFLMQTVGSWFRAAAAGLLGQIVIFSLVHPYNLIGVAEIAVSALIYGLVTVRTKGIEASSALHILNNATEIFMVGFGFGLITAEQTAGQVLFNPGFKILYLIFIFYAARKLHWFRDLKKDDAAEFSAEHSK